VLDRDGLASAGGTEKHRDLTACFGEVDPIENSSWAELLDHLDQLDRRGGSLLDRYSSPNPAITRSTSNTGTVHTTTAHAPLHIDNTDTNRRRRLPD
jgi:hypothetical protein